MMSTTTKMMLATNVVGVSTLQVKPFMQGLFNRKKPKTMPPTAAETPFEETLLGKTTLRELREKCDAEYQHGVRFEDLVTDRDFAVQVIGHELTHYAFVTTEDLDELHKVASLPEDKANSCMKAIAERKGVYLNLKIARDKKIALQESSLSPDAKSDSSSTDSQVDITDSSSTDSHKLAQEFEEETTLLISKANSVKIEGLESVKTWLVSQYEIGTDHFKEARKLDPDAANKATYDALEQHLWNRSTKDHAPLTRVKQ